MTRLAIILPVLNEIEHITPLIERLQCSLADVDYCTYFIDDGSTDGTLEVIKEAMLKDPESVKLLERIKEKPGCQRGAALYAGMEYALEDDPEIDVFVEMDGDLSHLPEEIKNGLVSLDTGPTDIVIMSKYLKGSHIIERHWARNLISFVSSHLMQILLWKRLKDYSNGFRLYSRDAAEYLSSHKVHYGSPIYLSEALAIWWNGGFQVAEIPSTYMGRQAGSSKFTFMDLATALTALIDITWRYHTNGFKKKLKGGSNIKGVSNS